MVELREGDPAPDFELRDQDGGVVRLSDFRGRRVVLFFYPQDDTPGCTVEACGFRDRHRELLDAGVVVLGVSPDDAGSHRAFRLKFGLPFPLLVDEGHRVAERWGAWGRKVLFGHAYEGVLRSTFVVGPGGRVERAFRRVKPEGHSREVLAAVAGPLAGG